MLQYLTNDGAGTETVIWSDGAKHPAWNMKPGDFVRHASSDSDWWEYVVGFDPDGRLVTIDPRNKLCRYSDPTDQWISSTDNKGDV